MVQAALQSPDPNLHFTGASQLLINKNMTVSPYYADDTRTLLAASLQYVRVLSGVATFYNGEALLRVPCNMPNGLYNVKMTGEFEVAKPNHKLMYPDVELLKPPDMVNHAKIPTSEVGSLVVFLSNLPKEANLVVLESGGIWNRYDSSCSMAFPFGLPNPVQLHATYLKIGLLELSKRCEVLYVCRETQNPEASVVFGADWSCCFMIAPIMRG